MPSHSSTLAPDGNNDDAIAQTAADWIVRLSADDEEERENARAGFDAWKRADPRHAAVAAGMERFVEQTRSLGGGGTGGPNGNTPSARAARAAIHAAFDEQPMQRGGATARLRRMAGPLALAFALVIPAAVALRAYPPAELMADLRTATGEQTTHVLADGTRLRLGTGSAVNVKLSPDRRQVELVSGEILVDVAKDANRPFVVETAHGRIRALGTRFIARRDADSTLLTMIESKTEVAAGHPPGAETQVEAGRRARLSPQGVERLDAVNPGLAEDAFVHRRLLVQGRPLPEVLDELARHRQGVIRYDRAEIDGIRVSAVLPLDDTTRALQLLVDSLPQLRVRTVTPWVVLVDSAP